jgi:uncharacterized membrane protein (DUF4010 family)
MNGPLSLLGDLALSLAIGLLIGVERGWRSRGEAAGSRVAGLRTFGLLGLLGGLSGVIGRQVAPVLAVTAVAGAVAAIVVGYARDMRIDGNVSATTTIAALLTLCLGVIATNGYAVVAVATAATITLLLASREQLHGWVAGMSERDVQATARFAIITAVVLPLLPNARYGPYEAWNPRDLWLVVVLVTGFSFAAYIANRRFGATRGTLATATIAGMYSSTAVTAALSRRLRTGDEPPPVLSAGIALASAMMFLRVLILTGILASTALPSLALAVAPAALVALFAAAWLTRRAADATGPADAAVGGGNPFELVPALGFALLVALLAIATRWAEAAFGGMGAAALIVITGSFDVDAAIVTLGGLPRDTIAPWLAGLVLAGPVLVNTMFKAAIVISIAGCKRGAPAAAPLIASAAALGVSLGVSFWWSV